MKLTLFIIICLIPAQIFAQRRQPSQDPVNNPAEIRRQQEQSEYWCGNAPCNNGLSNPYTKVTTVRENSVFRMTMQKDLKKRLSISKDERLKFETEDTKAIKLFNKPSSPIVISGTKYYVPLDMAIGSSYSFTLKDYVLYPFDIDLTENNLTANNTSQNQIRVFADIGDIAIEKLNQTTPQITDLTKFWVGENEPQITQTRKDLTNEILLNKMIVTTIRKVKTDHTYLLRTVVFNQKFKLSSDRVFAFRMVEQNNDIVTIIWKEVKIEM